MPVKKQQKIKCVDNLARLVVKTEMRCLIYILVHDHKTLQWKESLTQNVIDQKMCVKGYAYGNLKLSLKTIGPRTDDTTS